MRVQLYGGPCDGEWLECDEPLPPDWNVALPPSWNVFVDPDPLTVARYRLTARFGSPDPTMWAYRYIGQWVIE